MTREEAIEKGKRAYGCGWNTIDKEAYIADIIRISEEVEKERKEQRNRIDSIVEEIKGMDDDEAFRYTSKKAREASEAADEAMRSGDTEKEFELRREVRAYKRAYTEVFEPFRIKPILVGVYDTSGCVYGRF